MFKLIKWAIILGIIGGIWYAVDFYSSMPTHEREALKKDALEALDTRDAELLTEPLSHKVKQDLINKKASFFEYLKRKIKETVGSNPGPHP